MDDFEVKMYNPKKSNFLKYVIIALLVIVIAIGGVLLWKEYRNPTVPEDPTSYQLSTQTTFKVTESTTLSELYENVVDSVVTVVNKATTSGFPFGSTSDSVGSGFIVTEAGHIVTNYHVVSGASKLVVKLNNGNTYSAKVINYDSSLDIAVIKITPNEALSVACIGNAEQAHAGDWIFAIGTPYSEDLYSTITRGIISYSGRTFKDSKAEYIQIDAAINPGNSGGPLFNMAGEVIGINTSKIATTSVDNIGFAISANTFKPVVEKILGTPAKIKLGIGISGVAVADTTATTLRDGFIVMSVTEDGPADIAGIQPYDIIIKFDGVDVIGIDEIKGVLDSHKEGDVITVVVLRGSADNEVTLSLTLQNIEFYE